MTALARSTKRTKADWAGVSPHDAFNPHAPPWVRLPALRLALRRMRAVQVLAAQYVGVRVGPAGLKTGPQLSLLHAGHPAALAYPAALGLSAWCECVAWTRENAVMAALGTYAMRPCDHDAVELTHETYRPFVLRIAEAVHRRVLGHDLARRPELGCVETYRLFAASQQTLRFATFAEIVDAAVLFGDVLPPLDWLEVHSEARAALEVALETSAQFVDDLPETPSAALADLGADWVRALAPRLAPFVARAPVTPTVPAPAPPSVKGQRGSRAPPDPLPGAQQMAQSIAPLETPRSPSVLETPLGGELLRALRDAAPVPSAVEPRSVSRLVERLAAAATTAATDRARADDMRADLVDRATRRQAFGRQAVEGVPPQGHAVQADVGGDQEATGDVHELVIAPPDSGAAIERLERASDPVVAVLRNALYPNIEATHAHERLRTSGSLDPARLPIANINAAVFRRSRCDDRPDPRGRSVVLIACDASASLDRQRMTMMKVLATAWLRATAGTDVRVLCAAYTSANVAGLGDVPVVRWAYHPDKTPSRAAREAHHALAALGDAGSGAQSDALSLSYLFAEARRIARGRMVHAIIVSDCEWNRCFGMHRDGTSEMSAFLANLDRRTRARLELTLVALAADPQRTLASQLDHVIAVPRGELDAPAKVAERVALHVAKNMTARAARKTRRQT